MHFQIFYISFVLNTNNKIEIIILYNAIINKYT